MDITMITSILSGLKNATEIAKFLKESGVSLEKAETKLKLSDLYDTLAEIKMQMADVKLLLIEKDEEIRRLQDELKVKGELVFEMPYYWLQNENGKEGPFCQVCYDKDKKLVWLHDYGDGYWRCRVCGKNFDKNIKQRTREIEGNGWGGA